MSYFLDIEIGDQEQHKAAVAKHKATLAFFEDVRVRAGLAADAQLATLSAEERETVSALYTDGDAATELVFDEPVLRGGRLELELFESEAPKACENFRRLCEGFAVKGKTVSYSECPVHRVESSFCLQSGDVTRGDGSGGLSTFKGGKPFNDDRGGLALKHDAAGVLSMANSGRKNTNTSQFFITFGAASKLDGKHVVFGKLKAGASFDTLRAVEAVASADGKPREPVCIARAGKIE